MSTPFNPAGMLQPATLWGIYNNLQFLLQQALAHLHVATLVQVKACTNNGGVSPVGTVDVQILVNQISGNRVATPHLTMYSLPYLRIQGGANAVIIDPQPGDIGIALFADRDISNVRDTKAQSNPATFRAHDLSDGLYLGGILNGAPSQYVQFEGSNLTILSPGTVTITAENIVINGPLQQSGGNVTIAQTLTAGEDVVASAISLKTHVHGGVTSGGSDTGVPA